MLRAEGIRLDGERDPVVVQQEPGDPQGGWNGGLDARDGRTVMTLAYGNVDIDSAAEAGGWGEPCG